MVCTGVMLGTAVLTAQLVCSITAAFSQCADNFPVDAINLPKTEIVLGFDDIDIV